MEADYAQATTLPELRPPRLGQALVERALTALLVGDSTYGRHGLAIWFANGLRATEPTQRWLPA